MTAAPLQAVPLPAASDAARTLDTGTTLWTAPKVLDRRHGEAKYGPAVDACSFGIVMWGAHSWKLPYADVAVKMSC